jgi:hypothetical protein
MLMIMDETRQNGRWYSLASLRRGLLMIFGVCLWNPCLKATETRSLSSVLQPSKPLSERAEIRNKSKVLDDLKSFQNKQLQTLADIEQSIRKILQETQSVSLKSGDPVALEKQLRLVPVRLRALKEKREELQLRRDFIDQLIFQVDTKWTAQNLQTFLEQQLTEMALTDLAPASGNASASQTELWRFYLYLSIAIREIPEPREDLLAFVTGYMDFSTIRSPKSPLAFLESRNYTNGQMSQAANPAKREDVGSLVDRRLQELGLLKTPSATSRPRPIRANIELRTKTSVPASTLDASLETDNSSSDSAAKKPVEKIANPKNGSTRNNEKPAH